MSDGNFLNKTLQDAVLSRRSFLKWSAALGGTAALAGGLKYGLRTAEAAAAADEGKWVPVACWFDCGGRCLLKAHVVDGVVTKIKSDDTHPDTPDYPVQRACVRGRSLRNMIFAADRLKYPMKRKNWAPGGGKKELRGRDEWVRISWDEALDIVASELIRVKENYGNEGILAPFCGSQLMTLFGGAWEPYGAISQGGWNKVGKYMPGMGSSDRMDLRKSKLIVLWGSNPAWQSQGNPCYYYQQAKKAGAKIISVDPMYSATAVGLADEWIPVRPSTDTALLLAIAYHMIENNLQDQEFLDKYAVGFDRDHMPEGANPRENFKDYVLGTYDHVPKTPEWASEICGTDPSLIRSLAQQIGTTKPASLISGAAPSRTYMGEQYSQAFLTVGWMTGNLGIPGGMITMTNHFGVNGGPALVKAGATNNPQIPPNPLSFGLLADYFGKITPAVGTMGIVLDEVWDAVVNGEFNDGPRGKRKVDIRLLYFLGGTAALNQYPDINKGIEAFRKVDFVVSSDYFLTSNAKYADVVLPASTLWERDPGMVISGDREMIVYPQKIIEPLFEARHDATRILSYTPGEVERELAQRLGIDPDQLVLPLKQQVYNQLAGAQVMKADGSGYETLLTITADDIAELGAEGTPQGGRITYQEFKEKGIYKVPRSPNDNFGFIALKGFRDDPEANPLATPSGKLPIHTKDLVDAIDTYGYTKATPIATYQVPVNGYEDTFQDWDKKVKGKFPLQLWTPHYLRRAHSVFDNVGWLREAHPQELWMNTNDAEERGIQNGDTVLVTSPHGKVLRHAKVSSRIIIGGVAMGEGAWVERDDESGIDKAGAVNSLLGCYPSGGGVQPFNSVIVQVEKWTGETLEADYKWPKRVPLKEA